MKKLIIIFLLSSSSCTKNTYRCERLFKENLLLKSQLDCMQKVVRQVGDNAKQTELQNRRLREYIKYKGNE